MNEPVYVLFQFTVRDAAKMAAYSAAALPIVRAHGGRPVGAGTLAVLHGDVAVERGTLIEFPDRASVTAWRDDADYRALLSLRAEAMDCSVVMLEGAGPPPS